MRSRSTTFTRLIALLLALTLLVGVVGCGNKPAQDQNNPSTAEGAQQAPSTSEEAPTADEQATSDTVTVTDMAGRTVVLPSPINSIATFGSIGVINAFVELMGEGDKISNDMTANFTKSDKWAMQYKFAPQMKGAPILQNPDGEIEMEKVLALNPDLCLVMSKDLIEPLESNGLNVVYFEWKQTDDIKTAVTLLGTALGKEEVGKDYLTYFDEMIAEAENKTATLAEGSKKTVLYGNVDKLTQPHIIAEWWIEAAGGISVTADSWDNEKGSSTYTQEDILKWNPSHMIITDVAMKQAILDDSLYSDIAAIKDGTIHTIPTVAHVWGNRTVEQPLTVFWTMHKLYPELVTSEDLAEKIKYFYSHFFKYDLNEEQIGAIIGN